MYSMWHAGTETSTDAQSVEVGPLLSHNSHTLTTEGQLKLRPQLRTYSLHPQVPHRVDIDKRKVPEARQSLGLAHPMKSPSQ